MGQLKFVVALLLVECTIGMLGAAIWNDNARWGAEAAWYLAWDAPVEEQPEVKFFYYLLLLAPFVPCSLYVSLNVVKYFQARFIEADLAMYHEPSDTPCKVRTMVARSTRSSARLSHVECGNAT